MHDEYHTYMAKQIVVTLDDELLEGIEDYWFKRRLKSRASAIRRLIVIGLDFEKPTPPDGEKKQPGDF